MTDRAQLTTPPILHKMVASVVGVLILTLFYNQFGLAAVCAVVLLVLNCLLIISIATGWPVAGAQMRP